MFNLWTKKSWIIILSFLPLLFSNWSISMVAAHMSCIVSMSISGRVGAGIVAWVPHTSWLSEQVVLLLGHLHAFRCSRRSQMLLRLVDHPLVFGEERALWSVRVIVCALFLAWAASLHCAHIELHLFALRDVFRVVVEPVLEDTLGCGLWSVLGVTRVKLILEL